MIWSPQVEKTIKNNDCIVKKSKCISSTWLKQEQYTCLVLLAVVNCLDYSGYENNWINSYTHKNIT